MSGLRSIGLSLFVLAAVSYNSLVLVVFESNRDYFAREKCVQKEVSDNTCQGNCQLHELLQSEDKHKEPARPVFTEEFQFWLAVSESMQANRIPIQVLTFRLPQVQDLLQDGIKGAIWRPPR